ncbi:MAG: hypothetical protein JWP89_4147 [Schlesneria sp.]|nr:hypothetical protein [Schlesneria sp.]
MRDFFHGWRRKLGCVTLVMACAVSSAWLRSYSRNDRLDGWIAARLVHGYLVSTNGQINIIRRFPLPPDKAINSLHLKKYFSWRTQSVEPSYPVLLGRQVYGTHDLVNGLPDYWSEFEVSWRFDFAGFHFGEGRHRSWDEWSVQLWTVPYAALTLALTLLSAWLLLSKPRRRPQPTTASPDHA